jgi:glutaredoxin
MRRIVASMLPRGYNAVFPRMFDPKASMRNAHPEDDRLAAAGPREVTFYTRHGCHLCEEAKAAIAPLLQEFGAKLREVYVDDDPLLRERYGWDVPVIFIGAHKAAKHRVDVKQFRRQLRDAK